MTAPASPLTITVEQPRLDAMAAAPFRATLDPLLVDQPDRILLDLTPVGFIDSTGLGVLVSMLKRMGPGGRVAVVGAAPGVRRLFELTRLDSLFRLCDSEDEARAILA
ncbi:STAS domain-containing protein [Novosphingobium profundi]|uniref:STAS domain-containing protein n=1 Tax=Novosphingobium profundi TaxID=1774954 RepID=UPI001BDA05A1|nr:STAS domain-containing protein [Novosphingobium profundi]MBT0668017.1 STAS domain-containing protein [Novosphingobium profundi]